MKKFLFQLSCLLVIVSASPQIASAQNKFGFVNIGASKTETITVSIPYGGTIGTIEVLTSGTPNQDFVMASGGTCTLGTVYAVSSTCTVNVTFQPTMPGTRYGGVALEFPSAPAAVAYLQGTGFGPQTSFAPATQIDIGNLYVYNLTGVAVAGNGAGYYTSGSFGSSGQGGEIVHGHIGAFGNLPSNTQGFDSANLTIDPTGVSVDGAGIVCFHDIDGDTGYIPSFSPSFSSLGYTYLFFGGACPNGVVDGAGNEYTLPGPVKSTRQPDGSRTSSTVANLTGTSLAVDRDYNLFVAADELYKETLNANGTYTQTTIPHDHGGSNFVGIDGMGNLYLNAGGLFKETLQSNGTYLESPISVAVDGPNLSIAAVDLLGNIYLTTSVPGTYMQYDTIISTLYGFSFNQPPALTFAKTIVGSTSSDSPQTVTITNRGNLPLAFSGITYPADFSAATATGTSCTPSTTLAANASCTIGINFTPVTAITTSPAQLSESVVVTTNTLSHAGTQQSIQVTGQETNPPALSLSATSLAFPATTAGSVSAAQTVTLTNKGTAAITLGTVALTGANTKSFVLAQRTCGSSIAVGQSCTFALEFTPTKTGSLTATLGIVNNTAVSPEYVTLSGTGN